MKEIRLKELHLLNFKGARDVHVLFNPITTIISGKNGTGKTTIADAFHWLLFGKDSCDREKFDYKTLDSNGHIIPRLPHEVSGILEVNGKEIRLLKRVTEKWVRSSGESEATFKGNETERFFNDVPCTEKDYNAKIDEICSQSTFKLITNPAYFCQQKDTVQKNTLLKLAGEIKDADVAEGNKEFEEFLNLVSDKTISEFKKELNAKKNRIKFELSDKPSRIDEQKRKMPAEENWEELQSQLNAKEKELDAIEERIIDVAKRNEAADNEICGIYSEISEIRERIANREEEINHNANKEYEADLKEWNRLHEEVAIHKTDISAYERMIIARRKDVESLEKSKLKLQQEYAVIAKTINEINGRELSFTEDDFRCPTCGRVLDNNDIETKQKDLISRFKARKERDINAQKLLKEANIREGQALNSKIVECKSQIEEYYKCIKEITIKREAIESMPLFNKELHRININTMVDSDNEIRNLKNRISEMQNNIQTLGVKSDISTITDNRKRIVFEIDSLKAALLNRTAIEQANARIAQLEEEYRTLSAELNKLEGIEYVMEEFSKAKNRAIEDRINGLFKIVKFRWIAQQVNGAEKETCEATVNGVPYSVLNNAAQISAGLDIINAICSSQKICAPIFIDNSESINELPETIGQKILLQVTDDSTLIISSASKK